LRRLRELDHPVERCCAIAKIPCDAQDDPLHSREGKTRAGPDSIGAEAEISLGEPLTLVRDGKALAEPPGMKISNGQGVPNGHSQADVLRLVGAPNRLEEQVQALCDGPGDQPDVAEAVQDLAQDMRVAAPCRELPCFSEKRGCLVLRIAHTSEVQHDLGAHGGSLSEALRRLREGVQELPPAPPVPQRLGRIVEPHPLGRTPMPLCRFPSVTRSLPVVGEQRRTFAELRRVDLLDRTGDRGVDRALRSDSCER
jgi:hypothetical protein